MYTIASIILLVLFAFTGTALAADVAADPNTSEVLRQIFDAVVHGQWWIAACAAVVGLCGLARKYMPEAWKAGTKGDMVGVATAFAISVAGAVGTTLAAPGAVMSLAVLGAAAKIGVFAIGGWNVLHKVIGWLMGWSKLPAWAKTILGLVASIIGSSAVKKAEEASAAAVAANPAPGMNAGGKPREVE